jgi:hypothetical protein
VDVKGGVHDLLGNGILRHGGFYSLAKTPRRQEHNARCKARRSMGSFYHALPFPLRVSLDRVDAQLDANLSSLPADKSFLNLQNPATFFEIWLRLDV